MGDATGDRVGLDDEKWIASYFNLRSWEGFELLPGQFVLASTAEKFDMPSDLMGQVCDKSTWARQGLTVQNTIIEPGWRGFLTLELHNQSTDKIDIFSRDPIAQIIFMQLDRPTALPYSGKYQDQESGAQHARFE